jgi:hypothetical protein
VVREQSIRLRDVVGLLQALSQNRAGVERDCGPTAASVCIGGIGAACFDLLALGPQSRSLADAGF